MALLDRIHACDPPELANYVPFRVDAADVGLIAPGFADQLEEFADVFRVSADAVVLLPALRGFEARTRAVAQVLAATITPPKDMMAKSAISHSGRLPIRMATLSPSRTPAACRPLARSRVRVRNSAQL